MPISFNKGLAIADEHEPLAIKEIEKLGFKLVNHTTTTQNAKPKAERRYRDENGLIYPDLTFTDNETGRLLYVDLKTKTGPVYYFREGTWRHGNEAVMNYRRRSIKEGVAFLVVFEEPDIKGFTVRYGTRISPSINTGGYLIANVKDPFIGQEFDRKDLKYEGLCYYDRDKLRPITDIRKVARWERD